MSSPDTAPQPEGATTQTPHSEDADLPGTQSERPTHPLAGDQTAWLGEQASQRVVQTESLGAETSTDEAASHEVAARPILASWQEVISFGAQANYEKAAPKLLLRCLRNARPRASKRDELEPILDKLFVEPTSSPKANEETVPILNVSTAQELIRTLLLMGYDQEAKYASIPRLGIQGISFLADFVNHKLSLADAERLDLIDDLPKANSTVKVRNLLNAEVDGDQTDMITTESVMAFAKETDNNWGTLESAFNRLIIDYSYHRNSPYQLYKINYRDSKGRDTSDVAIAPADLESLLQQSRPREGARRYRRPRLETLLEEVYATYRARTDTTEITDTDNNKT